MVGQCCWNAPEVVLVIENPDNKGLQAFKGVAANGAYVFEGGLVRLVDGKLSIEKRRLVQVVKDSPYGRFASWLGAPLEYCCNLATLLQ